MKLRIFCSALVTIACCLPLQADEPASSEKEVIRVSVADGKIKGQVFAMFDDEKAPLIGKVSLTDAQGNTISTSKTDDEGNFAFNNVEPGKYKAVGIAGDYVGDTEIEATDSVSVESEGYYTAIPLAVAPAPTNAAMLDTYASLPAASFSSAQSFGGSVGGCSSCGGGHSVGTFGSGGGCGSGCGSGFNFRRLALIGAAVAIPLALSGGDDDNGTPAQN